MKDPWYKLFTIILAISWLLMVYLYAFCGSNFYYFFGGR